MSNETTLFDLDNLNDENYDDVTVEQDKDYFNELVGEGKKFKDPQSLAKGKMQSDMFIQKLQGELRELRERQKETTSVQELVEQVRKLTSRTNDSEPGNTNPDDERDQNNNELSEDKLRELISQHLEADKSASKRKQNLESVKKTLESTWGSGYAKILKDRADELGVTPDYLNSMAAEQPKVFLRTIGLDSEQKASGDLFNPPRSSVNTASLGSANNGSKKNFAFYEKMRKENPKEYSSARVQNEMFAQAKTLGDDFYA